MRVAESTTLPCSAEAAWSYLVDWEGQAEWMADADRVLVLGVREGVGVELSVRTRLYNVPAFTERLEVTTWDPPHRMTIAHRSLVKGTGEWEVAADGDGCRFTWTEDVTLPVVGDLIAGIYRPFLRKMMRSSLAALAQQISAPAS